MFTFCCIAVLVVGFSLVLAMLINMGKIRAMQHAAAFWASNWAATLL